MDKKVLLGLGAVAGPVYVTVSLAQALTREGFDLSRHAWSLLANGELGWVQVANFVVTGVLVVAGAVGLSRAGAGKWAAWLVGAYGASMIGAGVFRADPALGFPVGASETTAVSWHGMLHFMVGGIGFLCVIVACFVFGRRFARDGQAGLAWFSRITGVVFFAAFAGIASGSQGPVTLAFVGAVVVLFAWLTVVCLRLARQQEPPRQRVSAKDGFGRAGA